MKCPIPSCTHESDAADCADHCIDQHGMSTSDAFHLACAVLVNAPVALEVTLTGDWLINQHFTRMLREASLRG
jgi:hypothetical protein